jgi:excisionase family DNA binding protein
VEKLLVKVEEAANVLSVSRSQAYDMVRNGNLPYVRMGKLVRIPTDVLSEWVEKNTRIGEQKNAEGEEVEAEA